ELTQQIQSMFQNLGSGRRRTRKLKVREALRALVDEEAARLVNDDELKLKAIANVEANGIRFPDEVNKIASRRGEQGTAASRRDLAGAPVRGAAGHRGRDARVHTRRSVPTGADRVHDQRAYREYRSAAPAYGDGKAARGHILRGGQPELAEGGDRLGLRRSTA